MLEHATSKIEAVKLKILTVTAKCNKVYMYIVCVMDSCSE